MCLFYTISIILYYNLIILPLTEGFHVCVQFPLIKKWFIKKRKYINWHTV